MADRFQALTDVLLANGYIGPVVTVMDCTPPSSVAVTWAVPEGDGGRAAVQAIIDRWPWDEYGQDPLEIPGAKLAAKAVLGRSEPVIDMVRVFGRHIWDRLNEIAVHVGLEKKLEPTIFAELDAYVDEGLSLPGLRPDLELPPDGE